MSFATQGELVQEVLTNIGLVSGTSVQTYTEPQVQNAVQRIFDMLYRKRPWLHLSKWGQYTLDGVSGVVTDDLTEEIASFEDIIRIKIPDTDRSIRMSLDDSHLNITGSEPAFWVPLTATDAQFTSKVIKFYPIDATESVNIRYKQKPAKFISTDIVPFPEDVLVHAVSWYVLDSDGINPTAAARAQALFDITYKDYVKAVAPSEHEYGSRRSYDTVTIRS